MLILRITLTIAVIVVLAVIDSITFTSWFMEPLTIILTNNQIPEASEVAWHLIQVLSLITSAISVGLVILLILVGNIVDKP